MARPRRSESTREALIEAGIIHLSANGYHGTGIKQILDEERLADTPLLIMANKNDLMNAMEASEVSEPYEISYIVEYDD